MNPSRDLKELFEPRPTPARTVELPLLLADEDEWRGHLGALRLTLAEGSGRVRAGATLGAAARQAAELAVAAVLGQALPRWDVTLDVRAPEGLPAHIIDGDSLGLPVAVACRAAWRRLAAPQGLGFTGRVDPGGRVLPVGGMRLKAEAAAAGGLRELITGAGGEPGGALPQREVGSLEELWGLLWPTTPQPARRAALRSGLLLLGPALAITGITAQADHPLGLSLLRATTSPLPARETAIVALPELERSPEGLTRSFRERRDRLAPLIDQLVVAGARSVSFDLALNRVDPADEALAAALRRARAAGVPSVLALRWVENQGPLPPGSESLARLIPEGVVRAAHAYGEGESNRALDPGRVRLRLWSEGWIWHAAVETVASWSPGVGAPRLEDGALGRDTLIIGPLRPQAPLGRLSLRPVAPSPCWLFTEPDWTPTSIPAGCAPTSDLGAVTALRGRAVWIGVRGAGDLVTLLGVPSTGVDVQAAATEIIAAEAAPRAVGSALDAVLAGLMGPALAAGRRVVRPGAAGLAVLLFAPALALLSAAALGWLIAPVPLLVGALVGLWLGRDRAD